MARYKFYRNPSLQGPDEPSYSLRGDEKPKCIFLVEGLTEALFLERWLDTLNCNPPEIAVVCFDGLKVGFALQRLADDENFEFVERFGFFLDAEGGAATQKADAVTQALRKTFVIPDGHNVAPGEVSSIGGKRIALFVSPDNQNSGFIEHTIMKEIATYPLGSCIDSLRQCAEGKLGTQVSPKALVQAYLGLSKPGLCGTGRGFEKGILQVTHNAYTDLRTILGGVL